jgi:Ca2+-binding RTX toxin-like protein
MRVRVGATAASVVTMMIGFSGFSLAASAADSVVLCLGERATIAGTNEGDVIRGTNRRDVIAARGGTDIVRGRGGGDLICGDGGGDVIRGHRGSDSISGGAGVDDMAGNSDGDFMVGDDGFDLIEGKGAQRYRSHLDPEAPCARRKAAVDRRAALSRCQQVMRR